jgi:hypothetical protein
MRLSTTLGAVALLAAGSLDSVSAAIYGLQGAWHMDDIYTLVSEQLDPVITPNGQGSHMHRINGKWPSYTDL